MSEKLLTALDNLIDTLKYLKVWKFGGDKYANALMLVYYAAKNFVEAYEEE